MRRASLSSGVLTVAVLAAIAGCGGGGAQSQAVLQYAATAGAPTRYEVVAEIVPGDVPGRTISGEATFHVRAPAADGSRQIEIELAEIHLAGETGAPIPAGRATRLTLVRDTRHALVGEIEFGPDVAGADELARALVLEALVFPEGPLRVGDPFAVPALERPVLGDHAVRFAREARLTAIEGGLAVIEVRGTVEAVPAPRDGARFTAEGELRERVRVRIADGLLVERTATLSIQLSAALEDGSAIGTRTHRVRSSVRRLVGDRPAPSPHDWRPDRLEPTCGARLSALGRRFEHAPRDVDLAALGRLGDDLLEAADGRDLDEAGVLIVGADAASVQASLAAADLSRASVIYLAVPSSVDDATARAWVEEQPAYLERRRLVARPVDPPAPRATPRARAAITALRTADAERYAAALRPHLVLCRAASEALAEVGPVPALRPRLQEALQRCGCSFADLGELEHLLDARLGGPGLGWLPM